MKTITPKVAFKLFFFLLILFSATAFSYPKLPNAENSTVCESRIGSVRKVTNSPNTASKIYGRTKSATKHSKEAKNLK